jgi:predicted metal-dependent HD superfamily phosphohydrolase
MSDSTNIPPADLHRRPMRLRPRWPRLCDRLQLTGDVAAVWKQLHRAYTQPWRAYHNFSHLEDCLHRLDSDAADCDATTRLEIEAAIWFHDAVYELGAPDNEARSAALARACLAQLGAPPAVIERVANLILATDHRRPTFDPGARLICDLDLSILGRPADEYDRYARAIFIEVGRPEHEFAPHRQRFLRTMLSRPTIFHTDRFRDQYEAAARANLQRELDRWAQ